jgi:hypothetical protein
MIDHFLSKLTVKQKSNHGFAGRLNRDVLVEKYNDYLFIRLLKI